ncbi:hypothetical protein ACFLRM_02755 [Acidobacteriota bacterium]
MKTIKTPLFCGAIYFFLVAVAHVVGFKIPGLYIYFNVPSYVYQDKIISLLAFGWAIFFYTAAIIQSKKLIKSILIAGFVALAMLIFINLTADFTSLPGSINSQWFLLEAGLLFIYWLWLLLSYNKAKENLSP